MLAWWRRNDGLRVRPVGSATVSGACRRNLEALARLLNEDDENDRLLKAEVLRELGEFELAKEVLGRDGSSTYRGAARQLRDLCDRGDRCVRQLSFPESQDVGALLEMAKSTGDRSRLSAVQALGRIGPHAREAAPLLIEVLRNSDVETAFAARDALCQIGIWSEQGVPVLVELLSDESVMVRGMAAKQLGESGPHAKSAIPALQRALGDECFYVRMHVERALRSLAPW
jgi:HEAT repeat protein